MISWIKENALAIVALLTAGGVGWIVNPRGWLRRMRNDAETKDLRAGIEKNKTIRAEMKEMHDDIIELQREVREMRQEMHQVKIEKADLYAEVLGLRSENDSLKAQNQSLREALDASEQSNRK